MVVITDASDLVQLTYRLERTWHELLHLYDAIGAVPDHAVVEQSAAIRAALRLHAENLELHIQMLLRDVIQQGKVEQAQQAHQAQQAAQQAERRQRTAASDRRHDERRTDRDRREEADRRERERREQDRREQIRRAAMDQNRRQAERRAPDDNGKAA